MVLQTVETKAQNWNKNDGSSYIDLAVFAITPKKKYISGREYKKICVMYKHVINVSWVHYCIRENFFIYMKKYYTSFCIGLPNEFRLNIIIHNCLRIRWKPEFISNTIWLSSLLKQETSQCHYVTQTAQLNWLLKGGWGSQVCWLISLYLPKLLFIITVKKS